MTTLFENIEIEEISDSNEDCSDNARICIIDQNSDLIDALSNRSLENYTFEIKDNNASNIDKSLLIVLPDGTFSSMRLIEIFSENGSLSSCLTSKSSIKPTNGNNTKSIEEEIKPEHNSSPNTSMNLKCSVPSCRKIFTSFTDLKNHKRIHSGLSTHICEYCNHKFATGYGLKSHKRTHTGEKPYPCPEISCSKKFNTSGDLQKHIRTHTGERPFHCELCSKSFTTSNIRKVHMRTHTGEKPYECRHEGCNRKFSSATNFRNHTRIHTGEKPYVCSFENCQRRFTEYSSLYKHYLVHSVTKKYVCVFCKRQYKQLSTLNIHISTTHADICLKPISEHTILETETEAATNLIYDFNNEFSEKDDFDSTVMDCLTTEEQTKDETTESIKQENVPSPDEHSYTSKIWKGFLAPDEPAELEVEPPIDIQRAASTSFKPVEAITKGSEAILVLTTVSKGCNSSITPILQVETNCTPKSVVKSYHKQKKSKLRK